MTRGIVHDLAEWAAGLTRSSVPDAAIHGARRQVLDRFGISIGGTHRLGSHPTLGLAERLAGSPRATLWANGHTSHAAYAALANACAGDGFDLATGSGPDCVEAAIACAEVSDRSLGDLLVAVAAAGEVGGYLRGWLGEAIERNGLHPPALLGAASAATAAGLMLGLPADRLAGAIAGTFCVGPMVPYAAFSAGANGKSLYGGWPSMVGVWCALLARAGTTGPSTAIEGSRGVAQALLHSGGAVEPPTFVPPTDGWAVERIEFKAFPCNRACHPMLTAVAGFGWLDTDRITGIDVLTYPYAVELDRRSRGDSPIAAQLNLRRTLALFLALGGLEPGTAYTRSNIDDPRVRSLEQRITVGIAPEYAGPGPRVRGARVIIRLDDGSIVESVTDEPLWGSSRPATDDELVARFWRLVDGVAVERLPLVDVMTAHDTTPVRALFGARAHG